MNPPEPFPPQAVPAGGGPGPVLRPGEIQLWAVSLQVDARDVELWTGVLSREERGRADRYRFEDDRRRFVVARGLLRHLLEAYTGIEASRLAIEAGEWGKPWLRAPSRPLHFNLAHSGEWALIAMARDAEVGVDFEDLAHGARVEDLAGSICSPAEREAVEGLAVPDRGRALLRLWSAKEAYLKAVGTGLQIDPARLEADAGIWSGSPEPARLCWLDSPGISSRYVIHPLPECESWLGGTAAVAAVRQARPLRAVWMNGPRAAVSAAA